MNSEMRLMKQIYTMNAIKLDVMNEGDDGQKQVVCFHREHSGPYIFIYGPDSFQLLSSK